MAESLHLSSRHREEIEALLHKHLPGVEVWAYGSRVNGRSHDGSDLDLVLRGPQLAEIDASQLAEVTESLRESTVPFLIEARDWARLPKSFYSEIEREHVVLTAANQDDRPERKPRGSRPSPPTSRSLGMEGNTRPFGDLFAESTRNGLTRPKAVRGSGVKMVNMGELFAHPRLCNVPMDRVPLSQSEAERLLLEDGDLLFARQSLVLEGAGKCSIFLRDDEPVTFESHVTRVRLDQKKAHPGYYFYYLQSHQGRSAIHSIVEQGAGASGIRASDLATLEVQWRPLPEQRAIAYILGTLDDKIELNRRMNETLEAMARALFKSWFVDFDPVRAKMEGRDPGLPSHLADLFPDRLVDSDLGEIPEGWEVKTLAETVEIIGGGTPKTSVPHYWDGDIPWFSVVDAPVQSDIWVVDTAKKATQRGIENSSAQMLPVGTTIISARGTVGRIALVGVPMAMNQSCYGLRRNGQKNGLFNYFTIRALVVMLQQRTHGSVFDTITRDTLAAVYVVSPCPDVIDAYERLVWPAFERIHSGLFQSRNLVTIRDTLLPKLISGELRVKDATFVQSRHDVGKAEVRR